MFGTAAVIPVHWMLLHVTAETVAMKGAIGFLVGTIGLCLFASISILVPLIGRRYEALVIVPIIVAFVFLNVLVVGFYRMLNNLHETVLFPDDPHYHPPSGRVLFFVGYIGMLVSLACPLLVLLLSQLLRWHMSERESMPLLFIAWFAGWAFLGCLLGGLFMLLSDVYHKAFYRTMFNPPNSDLQDDLDISRRGPRRQPDHADDSSERSRRWDEE